MENEAQIVREMQQRFEFVVYQSYNHNSFHSIFHYIVSVVDFSEDLNVSIFCGTWNANNKSLDDTPTDNLLHWLAFNGEGNATIMDYLQHYCYCFVCLFVFSLLV